MEKIERLKTLEGAKDFLNGLTAECRKNLIEVMEEELEMMKKYRIIVTEAECYTKEKKDESEESVMRYNNTLGYSAEPLTSKILNKIFENNNVNKEIIAQELINKIDNKSLNPKEAEELVSLLSKTCVFGYSRPTEYPYKMILSYIFMLSPGEKFHEAYDRSKSFEDVLAKNGEVKDLRSYGTPNL